MRLIDTRALVEQGSVKLVEYIDDRSAPPYAILSHTWGSPDEEILFEDVQSTPASYHLPSGIDVESFFSPAEITQRCAKAAWYKMYQAALRARQDDLGYLWIDTCCIDKKSSAELSEAINSMYIWYQEAEVCYVYLEDFRRYHASAGMFWLKDNNWSTQRWIMDEAEQAQLGKCRWFTRGWTLQELLAPSRVRFFDRYWNWLFGRDMATAPTLSSITGIHEGALSRTRSIHSFSIAQRMHWASKRRTAREEDEAYSLLGLFNINMPLLYGEGRRAFRRLQEAIISSSSDASIFAWELLPNDHPCYWHNLFAPSVANFWWHAQNIVAGDNSFLFLPEPLSVSREWRLTNQGVHVPFQVHSWRRLQKCDVIFACLNCIITTGPKSEERAIGLRIANVPSVDETSVLSTYVTIEQVTSGNDAVESPRRLGVLQLSEFDYRIQSLLLRTSLEWRPEMDRGEVDGLSQAGNVRIRLDLPQPRSEVTWRVLDAYPDSQWDHSSQSFMYSTADGAAHGIILIEVAEGLNVVVVLGAVNESDRGRGVSHRFGRGYLQYWILPWGRTKELDSQDLLKLKKHLASLASKDRFELTTNRHRAHKAVNLCGNGIVDLLDGDCVTIAASQGSIDETVSRTADDRTKWLFEDDDSMVLELYLYLTLGFVQDVQNAASIAPLAEIHEQPGRVWDIDKQLIKCRFEKQRFPHLEVHTHAWYFIQSHSRPLWCLSTRLADFNTAIFDRRLWVGEWAKHNVDRPTSEIVAGTARPTIR